MTQYSDRFQQCCTLDGLHLSSYFQVLQSQSQSFGDRTKCSSYNWYHCNLHVPLVFQFSNKVYVLISLFAFLHFYSVVSQNSKANYLPGFLFLLTITGRDYVIICISKSWWILCVSFSWMISGLCKYYLFVWSNLILMHSSQWITFPTQSCQVLYTLCTNLLSRSHVALCFDLSFLSWVVYWGYTRPKGCLLSVHLRQMGTRPLMLMELFSGSQKTKQNKKKKQHTQIHIKN